MTTALDTHQQETTSTERPYKRHNGCLIVADYLTPAADQRFGYVLEPRS